MKITKRRFLELAKNKKITMTDQEFGQYHIEIDYERMIKEINTFPKAKWKGWQDGNLFSLSYAIMSFEFSLEK